MNKTLIIKAAGIGSQFRTGTKRLATMNDHADSTIC